METQRGEGLDASPRQSRDNPGDVAVILWDEWRQGRGSNGKVPSQGGIGPVTVTVTFNGMKY